MSKRVEIRKRDAYTLARRELRRELDRLQLYLEKNPHPADESEVLGKMAELVARLYL